MANMARGMDGKRLRYMDLIAGQMMAQNANIRAVACAKKHEFYIQRSDIEKELWHYKHHFQGQVVCCNCDDPRISEFFCYSSMKFYLLKKAAS